MKPIVALLLVCAVLLGCPNDGTRQSSKNSESARRQQKVNDAMYRVQESAEQALGEVEQSYKRAVNSAKEVKDQVVREASDAHQAAQELVANAKRAADVRESVQSNTEAAISAVEKALGIEPHSAEKTEPGKEGGTRGSP